MKNKTANEILKILKLLVAEDEETALLGVSLFQTCHIIQSMPKRFTLTYKWPGDHRPEWFIPFIKEDFSFSKQQFIKMLNSKNVPTCKKVCLIINMIYGVTDDVSFSHSKKKIKNINRNYNADLNRLLRSSDFNQLSSKTIESNKYIRNKHRRYAVSSYLLNEEEKTETGAFISELVDYGIYINNIDSISNVLEKYKYELNKRFGVRKDLTLTLKSFKSFLKKQGVFIDDDLIRNLIY